MISSEEENRIMPNAKNKYLASRAQVFKAMGHPTRLAIIDELTKGPRRVRDLNEIIDADMSTVSRHLSVLRNAGLVSSEKQGNQVVYTLRCPCVTTFYACVESVLSGSPKVVQLEVPK